MSVGSPHGPRAVPTISPAWNVQRSQGMPFHRYRPAHRRVSVTLEGRRWPDRRIERAPQWVPVDLRDGNQAFVEPMDTERKLTLFRLLVRMGFTEIEVGYPSASSLDFDFVRSLVDDGEIPDHVTIVVFTAARDDLIARTMASIESLPRAIVHMYIATAPAWREHVLGRSRRELVRMVEEGAQRIAEAADRQPATATRFQFSPEVFNATEPDFALEVCNAVTSTWRATPERPVIVNLPATVEIATPNVYADQIEWMDRHLERRDGVILSVHTHNDRGTGVAATELALMAGAERVEGCVFGNGERTGNVDLVTLALNLLTQGVDPMFDLSDLDDIRRTVEHCNRIGIHERHPYAGALTHTAYSGTHQDAIRKAMTAHRRSARRSGIDPTEAPWEIPYLPIDPGDIGRSYDAVIRVNSQSGKGGVAYVLETDHGISPPRAMMVEFARIVQAASEGARGGGEVTSAGILTLFEDAYMTDGSVRLVEWATEERSAGVHRFAGRVEVNSDVHAIVGAGNGPLDAFCAALGGAGVEVQIDEFHEHSLAAGSDADAVAFVLVRTNAGAAWGAATASSTVEASLTAVLRAASNTTTRRRTTGTPTPPHRHEPACTRDEVSK